MGTLIAIFLVYIIYFIFTVSRYDKNGHYKDKKEKYEEKFRHAKKREQKKLENELRVKDYEKLPSEVKFFVTRYKVDLEKVNIRGLLKMSGLILALCIAFSIIVIVLIIKIKDFVIETILCFLITMILYLIGMRILANVFKKRGLIKNDE